MELRQLRYLLAVVDAGGFTRGAERVHVAQPGVSAQIRQLERELGQMLLDRSGRAVRLTEAGAAVVPLARAALRSIAGIEQVADELTGLVRGQVRVGMVTSCGVPAVPELLARFHGAYPGIGITLTEADAATLVDQVQDGTLDLALVALGRLDPAGLELKVIADEAIVAVVARDHPLAERERIPLATLAEQTLISMPVGSGLRTVLDETCVAAGVKPRIALEATNPDMLARLAIRGLGVAIVPESTAEENAAELHALPVVRPALSGRLALAWRAEGLISTAARALIEQVREG